METPLHPTPMQRPMMKGKIYVDASNKPTFQGIWGMTHADVNKGGHTNDFKVVRMESVKPQEVGMPVFAGHYLGYFKLSTGASTETVNESFTLTFRGHVNHGYNVYGFGENRYGKNEIVGTVTQTGKMEIFKMIPGTTTQPDPNEPAPHLPRPANARAASPPPSLSASFAPTQRLGGSGSRPKPGPKKKSSAKNKSAAPPPPPTKNGLPGTAVRILKECLLMLRKGDKGNVFQFPVPPNFRGLKGVYADVIAKPMDLGTVFSQIDTKYRTAKECIEDVRLVFSNAKTFNPDTDPINALAASLSGKFEAFVSSHQGTLGLDGSSGAGSKGQAAAPVIKGEAPAAGSTSSSGAGTGTSEKSQAGPAKTNAKASPKASTTTTNSANTPLTVDEQEKLARDVDELFRRGNASPKNERAQARVYALWSFAKAYVADKDRVVVDGGKGAEIRMDALNHARQRQLRDVVSFFLEDSKNDPNDKNDPEPAQTSETDGASNGGDRALSEAAAPKRSREGPDGASSARRKRSRSDLSDSDDDVENERVNGDRDRDEPDSVSPKKRNRADSTASSKGGGSTGRKANEESKDTRDGDRTASNGGGVLERVDSSRLTLEVTGAALKEAEIDIDLEDEDDEDEDDDHDSRSDGNLKTGVGTGGGNASNGDGAEGDTSGVDDQWTQAQREKREMEKRQKDRAATEKALEQQRLQQQAQRERERVEEGLKLSRERAAEKARAEAAALEKQEREKREVEEKKEAERLAREAAKASVDLDQVRGNANLMDMMDASIYDD